MVVIVYVAVAGQVLALAVGMQPAVGHCRLQRMERRRRVRVGVHMMVVGVWEGGRWQSVGRGHVRPRRRVVVGSVWGLGSGSVSVSAEI